MVFRKQHICPELEDLRGDVCEPIHTYKLLSLQFDDTDDNCGQWELIGTIKNNVIVLDIVVWPTGTILKNYNTAKKTLRVVTKLASPFVLASELLEDNLIDCGSEIVCLHLSNTDRDFVTSVTDSFLEDPVHNKSLYIVHCCSGLAIDVLSELSREFEFSFILFFTNDSNFGTLIDGKMTGLLGDVMSGTADMIIGAFSITSERMKYISYSAAFYHSSFSMVSIVQERSTAISAFLDPFDPVVWVCLICAATFTGSMISLLEWLSPYGLNPRGKKRDHNYTLGSGLTMVFSTLFGHTYRIKSPKSWPSKVLQIFWSCLAIFTTANYTAKLAAFLAAQDQTLQIESIYDKQVSALTYPPVIINYINVRKN